MKHPIQNPKSKIQSHKFQIRKWLFLGAWCLTLGTWNLTPSQVLINEYSCANVNSFADNFSEYEDWIELYNTTGSSVNLTGWYLSDKKTNPTKWQLGNVTINANGFLRIWASGRDINTGTLHANFKLTQCKPEAIVLANAAGTIIDSLTLKRNQRGHSRGRTTDGAATWSVFTSATPNASNTSPQQEYATTPTMSVAAGFYASAQNVTITSPDPNITIRYTTNGSTPTAASTAYTAPVAISSTTVLRARAFSSTPGIPESFVESNTYFINSPHTVEVVSAFGDQLLTLLNGTQSSPETGLEYFDASGTFRTEGYGNSNKHGNDSWSYPHRGIDFICYDQYGYNYALQHPIFNSKPRTEYQRIILKASAGDNYPFETTGNPYAWGPASQLGSCHIRDQYVHTVSQKAKMHMDERTWAPSVLYANGQYWGVYDTREKVDDADFTDYYHNSDSWFRNSTNEDSLQMLKTWGGTWSEYGGNTAQSEWNTLANFITSNNMAVQANYDYVDSLYSLKSLADYVILNSYVVTSDWLNWNTIWWRGKHVNANKRKWRYDLWDEDATFDHYINYTGVPNTNPNADPCDPESLGDPGGQGHVPILNAMMQSPIFKQYFIMRYFDLINTGLSCTRMIQILDSMILVIDPEMPAQINRWNAWGGSYAQWQQNVQDLKNFINARCLQVQQQFDDCYNTTGPFTIKVNVAPSGAGTVELNSLLLSSFVWSGNYPGNLPMIAIAHPTGNYCFDYWEFQNHTPQPSINDTAITFTLTATDSIVAHFSTGSSNPVATASFPSICVGDTTQLQVSSGSSFTWSPATGLSCTTCPNPIATPTVTTNYVVTVSGPCASGTASVTVTVQPPPTLSLSGNVSICPGTTAQLSASGGTYYTWSPDTGLSCVFCPSPVASPTATTTYYIIASNGPGINCMDADSLTVFLTSDCPDIYVPTGFSPNGDNNNDMFTIFGSDIKELLFKVYNRWGQIVFETKGTKVEWDGTHNGKPLQSGVYAYTLTLTTGKDVIKQAGNITVVR